MKTIGLLILVYLVFVIKFDVGSAEQRSTRLAKMAKNTIELNCILGHFGQASGPMHSTVI